jgi:hypothetical protein
VKFINENATTVFFFVFFEFSCLIKARLKRNKETHIIIVKLNSCSYNYIGVSEGPVRVRVRGSEGGS